MGGERWELGTGFNDAEGTPVVETLMIRVVGAFVLVIVVAAFRAVFLKERSEDGQKAVEAFLLMVIVALVAVVVWSVSSW